MTRTSGITHFTKKLLFILVFIGTSASQLDAQTIRGNEALEVQRDVFEKIIRDYILENPEIVEKAILKLEKKKKLATIRADEKRLLLNYSAIFRDPDTPVFGNVNGDISVVEFIDYGCGVCKRFHPIIKELVGKDRGLRLVYKQWPILGPNSVRAARAAIASQKQSKYEAFHNALMKSRLGLSAPNINKIAQSVGINTEQLTRDMKNLKINQIIRQNYRLAEKLGLNGTPSLVIGNKLLRGGRDLQTLVEIVKEVRAELRARKK